MINDLRFKKGSSNVECPIPECVLFLGQCDDVTEGCGPEEHWTPIEDLGFENWDEKGMPYSYLDYWSEIENIQGIVAIYWMFGTLTPRRFKRTLLFQFCIFDKNQEMNISEIRTELHQLIDKIENEEFLMKFYNLLMAG